MKKYNVRSIKFYAMLVVILNINFLQAQVSQEWVSFYSYGISNSTPNSIVVDGSGNVYVTGQRGGSNYDYATLKYNSSGVQQWVQTYNGPGYGDDYAYSLAVDNSGNVYVTGWSLGKGTGVDFATIKYNSSGIQQWVQRYNGPVNNSDAANSLAIDDSGNVYVTGVSYRSSFGIYDDYLTIKYNSSGDSVWVRRYNGTGNRYDGANSIAVDASGNVYVTGYSSAPGDNYDYVTIKYNSVGDSLWIARYNGPSNYQDVALKLAIDTSGNVYVTGYSWGGLASKYDYATIKYNSSGIQQWVQRYNGVANRDDEANSIGVDGSGNVYVTGASFGADSDYVTIKYNPGGVEQWVQRYNGPGNYKDYARSMVVDSLGNVYVTGWSYGGVTSYDFATIKYSPTGIQEWIQRYHANNYDGANSIAIDVSGNVYVTGNSAATYPLNFYRYATIKYSPVVGIKQVTSQIPDRFNILQNYPNPFNPSTKIRFSIPLSRGVPEGRGVLLIIYDVIGREVATLVNEQLSPGTYEVNWPTPSEDASEHPSGVYYYKLVSGNFSETKKMILLK